MRVSRYWPLVAAVVVACLARCALCQNPRDNLAKNLATMFLMKEGNNVPSARTALSIFQAVTHQQLIVDSSLLNKLVQFPQTTLQQKIAGLAPDFTEILGAAHPNFAYFTDPSQNVFSDLTNFLTEQGTTLATVSGPNFINDAACIIGTANTGVSIAPSAISIIPQLISIAPAGVGIVPEGINIQPAAIYLSPYGTNVDPDGINIIPTVIGIAPLRRSVAPAGVGVTSSIISVTGPTASGRRLLEGSVQETTPAAATAAPAAPPAPEDLFLASYERWIDVVSRMAISGAGSPSAASDFLQDVFQQTGQRLSAFQDLQDVLGDGDFLRSGFNLTAALEEVAGSVSSFYLNTVLADLAAGDFNLTDLVPSGIVFSDPVFFNNAATNVSSTTTGVSVTSAFINYAPCLISNAPSGVTIAPAGINIQPNGAAPRVYINPEGVNIQPQGINIQPTAILIGPVGDSITPQGILIQPEIISIAPVYQTIGDTAVSVADSVVSVP